MILTVRAPVAGLLVALGALAACSSNPVPNTYAAMSSGVGFGDYQRHLREREGAQPGRTPGRAVPYSIPPEGRAAPVAPVQVAPVPMVATTPLPVTVIPAAPAAATPAAPGPVAAARPAGVNDTGTFTPIPFGQRPAGAEVPPAGQTEIVHVAAVPSGSGSGPNVMAYALQTTHAVGTQMYRRNHPLRWSRWERNCLQHVSQDMAQEAFLAAGGPERDPNHLDPDGDGFACWWDPEVYRRAARIAAPVQGAATE